MSVAMDIELILFDWGGTLAQVVRQDELLRRGAEAAVRTACAPPAEDAATWLISRVEVLEREAAAHPELREADFAEVLSDWAQAFDGRVNRDCLGAALDAIGREWIGSLEPLPGAREAVQTLRRRGLRMGLVSNCMLPAAWCRQELARQGFAQLLDFAVFSSEVGYRKPSPKIYNAALRQAFAGDIPKELSRVLFVGDSPVFDVAVPASMGMKTALVTCYRGIWPKEHYERANPDLRIDAVAELPERLGIRLA